MLSTKKSRLKKIKAWEEQADDEAARSLVRFFEAEGDESLKCEAVRALGTIRSVEIFAPLGQALHNENLAVRTAAARSLGDTRHPDAVHPLLTALADAEAQVRSAAAEALGRIGDARAADSLIAKLRDSDLDVSSSAARALASIGHGRALKPLLQWIERAYTSSALKMSAQEKLLLARELTLPLIQRLDEAQLQSLTTTLPVQVSVKSWEVVNPDTSERGWAISSCKNPLWKPIQEELEARKHGLFRDNNASDERADGDTKPDALDADESDPFLPDAPAERVPSPEIIAPRLSGIVAEFMAFLRARGLLQAVVVGGALRDAALGREPQNIDITVEAHPPADLMPDPADPVGWNMRLAERTQPTFLALAQALGCAPSELIAGKAVFFLAGQSLPVLYVGPYVLEETQLKRNGLKVEQQIHRTVSRLGLVADRARDQLVGLAADATINRMWSDLESRWHGGAGVGLDHARERRIHFEDRAGRAGALEIFRAIALKHSLGFELTDGTIDVLEAAALRIAKGPGEEFPREAFDKAAAAAGLEDLIEQVEALNLLHYLKSSLDPSALLRVNDLLARRDAHRRNTLEKHERRLAATREEHGAKKADADARRARFRERLDLLDAAKTAKAELEARLRKEIERLRESDSAAQSAADRLGKATHKFRALAQAEQMDQDALREHRDALADKKVKDETLDALRNAVEGLRAEMRDKQATLLALDEEIARQGSELEQAGQEVRLAQGRVDDAERELAAAKDQFTLTPQRRRDRLRSGPVRVEEQRMAAS